MNLRYLATKSIKPTLTNHARSIQPSTPAITRFAPSPTGFLHLGSMRTALYNYLLAKSTNGKFILRLEDTDQSRTIEGAEQNIYDTLKWAGITPDESPTGPGANGPYRQSERKEIYQKYVNILIDKGLAYPCYCSKERLGDLRESAMKLRPPTTVTYDRKCFHDHSPHNSQPVIRFKSPDQYPKIEDLVHGTLNLQPQFNLQDRRYDDFVILKSDGLPTYHFANVIDDHLMGITHVIRGEEWLTATPKHIALYRAFGWEPPKFIHIPLLTSLKDKKLSKRDGALDILSMRSRVLPETLLNFVALFGWSPPRAHKTEVSEVMTLDDMIGKFSLDNLTKGNAKVSEGKLKHFNRAHMLFLVKDEKRLKQLTKEFPGLTSDAAYLERVLKALIPVLNYLDEVYDHEYLFRAPVHDLSISPKYCKEILEFFKASNYNIDELLENDGFKIFLKKKKLQKKDIWKSLRFALTNGKPGLTAPMLMDLITLEESKTRIETCLKKLEQNV